MLKAELARMLTIHPSTHPSIHPRTHAFAVPVCQVHFRLFVSSCQGSVECVRVWWLFVDEVKVISGRDEMSDERRKGREQ